MHALLRVGSLGWSSSDDMLSVSVRRTSCCVATRQLLYVAEALQRWNSPMKEPALQIRLKTQLSGGSVPHLLQSQRWRTGLEVTGGGVSASSGKFKAHQWPPVTPPPPIGLHSWRRLPAQCETLNQNFILTKNKTIKCLSATLGIKWHLKLQLDKPFTHSDSVFRVLGSRLCGKIEWRAGISWEASFATL